MNSATTRRAHPIVYLVLCIPFGAAGGDVAVTLVYLLAQAGVSVAAIAGLLARAWNPRPQCTERARARRNPTVRRRAATVGRPRRRGCGGEAVSYYRAAPLMIVGKGASEILQLVIKHHRS